MDEEVTYMATVNGIDKKNGQLKIDCNVDGHDDDDDVDDNNSPPDGGTRAWMVMIGSFLCNGILFGVINSYSVIYNEIYENLNARNVSDASSKAALVGSLAMGTTFMVSPVAGVLTDTIGIRRTTLLGGILASSGMFLSSFVTNHINALYLTYGTMYGLGSALTYTPSLAILGHYFKKRLGIINGIVTAGSSVFTILLPYLIDYLIREYRIEVTLRLIALMASGIIGASLLFKPIKKRKKCNTTNEHDDDDVRWNWRKFINLEIFANKQYMIWCIVLPLSLFGYFVPYVHMLKFVKENYAIECSGMWPVICIGLTSGIGRLLFGYLSDMKHVDRIQLQQIAFFIIGCITSCLPSTAGNYPLLIVLSLLMGLFDGCFIAVLGPIAFDLCGRDGATQAIGMLLGLCSIPLTLGPYLAGILYDHQTSYHLAFRLAGIPPIIGCFALFLIHCVPQHTTVDDDDDEKEREKCKNGNYVMAACKKEESLDCFDEDNNITR